MKDAYTTRVVRNAASVSAKDWQRVFSNVLEGYGLFKTLDECRIEQFSFYYILVYHKKTLSGIAPCFMVNYSLDTSISGPFRRVSNRIKRYRPNLFSLKALVCGLPIGEGRIGIAGDADKIMKAIVRKMEQLGRKKRASVIAFKDFGRYYTPLLDSFRRRGFAKFESLPMTELAVRFPDFDEYLKTLSQKSRYDLRRKFKKVDGHIKIDHEVITQPDEKTYQEIYRLYREVVDKHEMGFEVLPIDFFKDLPKNMPDNVKYFLWRINDKLVAFSLCLVSDDLLIGYYIGLDYSVAYDHHLYFVKFRDILNWCIRHNIKKYELGYTGYEVKRRLRFDLIPVYLYVKLRNRLLRPVFNLICQFLKFENFDPDLKRMRQERMKT